jgi:hypothetical protein
MYPVSATVPHGSDGKFENPPENNAIRLLPNTFESSSLHFLRFRPRAQSLPIQCDLRSFAFSSGEEKVNQYTRKLTRRLTPSKTDHLTFF